MYINETLHLGSQSIAQLAGIVRVSDICLTGTVLLNMLINMCRFSGLVTWSFILRDCDMTRHVCMNSIVLLLSLRSSIKLFKYYLSNS